jgi:hypothetical protein
MVCITVERDLLVTVLCLLEPDIHATASVFWVRRLSAWYDFRRRTAVGADTLGLSPSPPGCGREPPRWCRRHRRGESPVAFPACPAELPTLVGIAATW